MRVRHKRTLACRILLAVLLLVIIVCAAAGGIWLSAMHSLGKHAVCGTDSGYETDGCVLEDTVLYHGKTYRRNEKISTILCMGLDTENDMKSAGGVIGSGAQSDANFLVVIDREQKKLRIVAIPRDTMTDLETFYMTGSRLDYCRIIWHSSMHLGMEAQKVVNWWNVQCRDYFIISRLMHMSHLV